MLGSRVLGIGGDGMMPPRARFLPSLHQRRDTAQRQRSVLEKAGFSVIFRERGSKWPESSHKYSLAEVGSLTPQAGLRHFAASGSFRPPPCLATRGSEFI